LPSTAVLFAIDAVSAYLNASIPAGGARWRGLGMK
jgi:hypothetical protein